MYIFDTMELGPGQEFNFKNRQFILRLEYDIIPIREF